MACTVQTRCVICFVTLITTLITPTYSIRILQAVGVSVVPSLCTSAHTLYSTLGAAASDELPTLPDREVHKASADLDKI